jgi:hypothetical protein
VGDGGVGDAVSRSSSDQARLPVAAALEENHAAALVPIPASFSRSRSSARPRLLVAPVLLPPSRPPRLDRPLKRAQSLSADDALEVRFDEDDVCAFGDVREVLAPPAQVRIDGTFRRGLDTHRDAVRERGICAKVRR